MTQPWQLRVARAEDAARLAVLGAQVWMHTYVSGGVSDEVAAYVLERFSPAQMAALLADAERHVLVAEGPGGLLGYATLHLNAPREGMTVELETLYLQASAHGSGLGQALLAAVRQAVPALQPGGGGQALWFSVNARNERALRFYRRAGAVEFGETYFELGEGRHRNLLMRLDCPGRTET